MKSKLYDKNFMSSEQSIKVIFDTNICISYLIGQQINGFTRFESFRGNRNFGTSRI